MQQPAKFLYLFRCDKCMTFQIVPYDPVYYPLAQGYKCPSNQHYSSLPPITYMAVSENSKSMTNKNERIPDGTRTNSGKGFKLAETLRY